MIPNISIIHPSRGRVLMAYFCYKQWMENATYKNNIQYILSVDYDDPALAGYTSIAVSHSNIKLVVNGNNNVVDAMNTGSKYAKNEILVCVSDDFSCFEGWDEWIIENINPENKEALGVYDGLQPTTAKIMTLPIITKKLYDELGYIYDPRFIGMYADNFLAEKCIAMGVYKENKTKTFFHSHWCTGKRQKDETNLRHDNPKSWEVGLEILRQERLINFGVKKKVVTV